MIFSISQKTLVADSRVGGNCDEDYISVRKFEFSILRK